MSMQHRLAEVRQKRGLSAAALAAQAGVSRQTIYAIEAGQYVPNTLVALRLGQALGVAVEELFRLQREPGPARGSRQVELLAAEGAVEAGQSVRLCRVGRQLVGVFAPPFPAELPAADGVVVKAEGSRAAVIEPFRAEKEMEKRLLVAGCDPGMAVLARHLAQQSPLELITAGCSSLQALEWLRDGKVHIAGSHLSDEASGESNLPMVKKLFPRGGYRVITFALWEEGLVAARGNPKGVRGIEDLARQDVTLVNRQAGAGSRFLLDRALRRAVIPATKVRGYDQIAPGHMAAAWHVYAGQADCSIVTRAAARAFGLPFLPLAQERYDLVIPRRFFELPAVDALLDTMSRLAFRRELEALGGYDTSQTGTVQA
ncbi:MAG: helix-turn-helix domain-containing protein [Acidobacteria bacterium]|nr:helix-turn-helix domain-containing protein [Acidobacteriota bacterium]